MIAIFNTELESVEFSDKIHNYLLENRKGYNAEKWSDVNKSDNENKWAVFIPEDFTDLKGIELIEKLPDNWRNEEII